MIVNDLFGRWQTLDGGLALLAIYAFAFQIYGDFSGYTDIARGRRQVPGLRAVAQLQPARTSRPAPGTSGTAGTSACRNGSATTSTSRWAAAAGGTLRTYRNLMLTMILGGLWHGAAWTFVLWGVYQGLLLVVHRARRALAATGSSRPTRSTAPAGRACGSS